MARIETGGLIGEIQSTGSEYDVFLNFRGPDARKGISDHLFHSMTKAGLHVFKDDEKFHRGEEIGIELKRAINDSKIYVVVFTKDYASSAWCLRELTMMVDCRRASSAGEKVILPVFYDVDPDDVKKPTGLYHREVDKHENKHGPEIVQKWKEALSEVGRIGGWNARTING